MRAVSTSSSGAVSPRILVFARTYPNTARSEQGLLRCLEPAIRSRLRERGLAIAADFSWRANARQTLDILQEAAQNRPRR